MRIDDLINSFVLDVCHRSNSTAAAYRSKLNHLALYSPDCEKINQATIDGFKMHLLTRETKRRGGQQVKGKLSIFTIRSVLATTRHFLRWGAKRGYFPPVELRNIKEPFPDPKPIDALSIEKLLAGIAKLGEAWEQVRNTALLYVLRDSGGRIGAISRMDIDCLNLAAGYATTPDKNNQLTWLWFNPPALAALRAWLEMRSTLEPQDYRVWTSRRGAGLTTSGIRHVLYRLARVSGISGRCNPHAFRHAFARDAILAGADLGQVSEMLGHSGIAVTHKYYARWNKKELQEFHRKYSPGRNLPMPKKRTAKP